MTATNMCSNFGGFRCSPPLLKEMYLASYCLFCMPCAAVLIYDIDTFTSLIRLYLLNIHAGRNNQIRKLATQAALLDASAAV